MKTQHSTLSDARAAAGEERAEGHRGRIMRQTRPGWRTYTVQISALRKTYQKTYYPCYDSDGRQFWLTVPNDC